MAGCIYYRRGPDLLAVLVDGRKRRRCGTRGLIVDIYRAPVALLAIIGLMEATWAHNLSFDRQKEGKQWVDELTFLDVEPR